MSEKTQSPKLPVIPETCGECESFDRWNDGSCKIAPENAWVDAERNEAPPPECPKRHACPTCGRYGH